MTDGRPRIVVLHALRPTSRQTTISHLTSFRRHLPNADVQYLHFAQPLPPDLEIPSIDVLIVNYDFLNYRFTPLWPFIKDRWITLARRAAVRVAIPQDDFWASRLLDKWCERWEIDRVLTPLDTNLDVVYRRTRHRALLTTVLTGYADASIAQGPPLGERPLDLGQRVRHMLPHLGRYGQEKSSQAMHFAELARAAGMAVDVSDRNEDAFLGEAWLDFLRRCRFTVSMKGGASRVDPFGLEYLRVQRYLWRHPHATYDEVAARCFRHPDGVEMSMTSPRLFEAAATGTCQILPPADYLGVLEPWVHYLPLERDFSNSTRVLEAMHDHEQASAVALRARQVLVDSGRFDDSMLVREATDGVLGMTSTMSGSSIWCDFTGALNESSRFWCEYGPAVHDAVQEAVRVVIDMRLSVDDARVVATDSMAGDSQVGLRAVLQFMESEDKWDWFRRMLDYSRKTPTFVRSPWTWRPL